MNVFLNKNKTNLDGFCIENDVNPWASRGRHRWVPVAHVTFLNVCIKINQI